jgi:hypothetical protein
MNHEFSNPAHEWISGMQALVAAKRAEMLIQPQSGQAIQEKTMTKAIVIRLTCALAFACILAITNRLARAQDIFGVISGTVTDTTDAVIPGASPNQLIAPANQ